MADVDRHGADVSEGMRAILRVQTRLYNITGYGALVETMIGGEVSGDRWGVLWTESEYETLFRRFPLDGARPSDSDVAVLAAELGRTPDAISWQWGDGAAYASGRSASTASDALKAWLDARESDR